MLLRNYLKTTLRSLLRGRVYTALNILGFAMGLACCLTIMLWVHWQWSFNRFNENLDNTYFLRRNEHHSKEIATYSAHAGPLATTLKAEFPEIKYAAALNYSSTAVSATVGGRVRSFRATGMNANEDVFRVFTLPFVQGGITPQFLKPSSILLSEELAIKLFGTTNVLGNVVKIDGEESRTVTAVYRNIPKTASLEGDYVTPLDDYITKHPNYRKWDNNTFRVFIQTTQPVSPAFTESLNAKLKPLLKRKADNEDEIFAQPMSEMYLYNKFENGVQAGGRIESVRLFVVIAVLVLLIACVNFMNLATARAARRGKEIGIRKVVGASRFALMGQVWSESVLTALLSLPLAILLVEAVLPALRTMMKVEIFVPYSQPLFYATMLGLVLLAGLISGLYPALMLSGMNTSSVLKGAVKSGRGALAFRRGLVVFEFTIAVAFICATTIVYRQMDFIKNANIGLNRENVLVMPSAMTRERYEAWKQELKGIAGVVSVGGADTSPLSVGSNTTGLKWRGKSDNETVAISILYVDYDFFSTMGITVKAGRGFSAQFPSDSSAFMFNEAAIKAMRFQQPLGERVTWGGNGDVGGPIIGVVNDFHHQPLRYELEPLVMMINYNPSQVFVRLAANNGEGLASTIEAVRKSFEKYQPEAAFDYSFMDEDFDKLYKTEVLTGRLALYFSLVAVVVCCLGLFGLAAFMAETRTKEIGIRKVLGASVASIVALLSRDFLILVLAAIAIATPLAYWAAGKWLQEFAYRTELSWWLFASSGVMAIVIAFATVASQAWRAAGANPVQSLRSE